MPVEPCLYEHDFYSTDNNIIYCAKCGSTLSVGLLLTEIRRPVEGVVRDQTNI